MSITTEEVHTRTHKCCLSAVELERLIADIALERAGVRRTDRVKVSVRLENQVAGSPEYKVGVRATIDIIEDLGPMALSAEEPPPGGSNL